jgi:hypothetical protein
MFYRFRDIPWKTLKNLIKVIKIILKVTILHCGFLFISGIIMLAVQNELLPVEAWYKL